MSTDQTQKQNGVDTAHSRVFWPATILLLLLFWLTTLSSIYLYWNGYMTGIQTLFLILCPWLALYGVWKLAIH